MITVAAGVYIGESGLTEADRGEREAVLRYMSDVIGLGLDGRGEEGHICLHVRLKETLRQADCAHITRQSLVQPGGSRE